MEDKVDKGIDIGALPFIAVNQENIRKEVRFQQMLLFKKYLQDKKNLRLFWKFREIIIFLILDNYCMSFKTQILTHLNSMHAWVCNVVHKIHLAKFGVLRVCLCWERVSDI